MKDLFLTVVNMSLAGGIVIVVILLARLALRPLPKKWSYALWSAAALRLCCPVSLKGFFSIFSLSPLHTAQPSAAVGGGALTFVPRLLPAVPGGADAAPAAAEALPQAAGAPEFPWLPALVWLAGAAALVCYGVYAYLRMKRLVADAVPAADGMYETDRIASPFLLGLLRPRIYVPAGLEGERRRCVLLHERFHLRRGDYLVKALAFLVLAIHWFNPLVWLAFHLMSRDMEMRCDEAVLDAMSGGAKEYGTALLSFAAPERFPAAGPLCFGESGARQRIRNVLRWKKPRLWVTLTAAAVCLAVVASCAVNPGQTTSPGGADGQKEPGPAETGVELPFTPGGVCPGPTSVDPAEGVRIRVTEEANGFTVEGVNVKGLSLTVTLPAPWATIPDLYTYKITDNTVAVCCRAAQEDGAPGRLFTVACVPGFIPLNADLFTPGSVLAATPDYSVLLRTPSDVQYTESSAELYRWMEQLRREELTVTLSDELVARSYHPGNWPEGTVTIRLYDDLGVFEHDAPESTYVVCNEETSAALRAMVERRSFTVPSGTAPRLALLLDGVGYYVNQETGELLLGSSQASPERLSKEELAVINGAVENAVPMGQTD